MMRRETLFVAVLTAACLSTVFADTLVLKDGRTFKGQVVKRTATDVTVKMDSGAEMGFKMEQVATIEIAKPIPAAEPKSEPRAGATAARSGPISSDLQAEVQKLRDEMNALKETHRDLEKQLAGLKDMREKLDSICDVLKDVDKRASRLPPQRGDFAGSVDRSRFSFEGCTVERGGDEFKIHGYIRNVGSSPGVWARIISELHDDNGNIVQKNDVNPTFTSSGSHETRDKSILSPGERFEFDSYIPFGRWASSGGHNIGIKTDALPPGGKDPKNIADTVTLTPPGSRFRGMQILLKLEVPPKDKMDPNRAR